MSSLRWTEWLQLVFWVILLGLLVWFGTILRQLDQDGHNRELGRIAREVQIWTEAQSEAAEQTRLLQVLCLNSVTIYDAQRGACAKGSTFVPKIPPLPTLKSDRSKP